jgi:hypothetical protein
MIKEKRRKSWSFLFLFVWSGLGLHPPLRGTHGVVRTINKEKKETLSQIYWPSHDLVIKESMTAGQLSVTYKSLPRSATPTPLITFSFIFLFRLKLPRNRIKFEPVIEKY